MSSPYVDIAHRKWPVVGVPYVQAWRKLAYEGCKHWDDVPALYATCEFVALAALQGVGEA